MNGKRNGHLARSVAALLGAAWVAGCGTGKVAEPARAPAQTAPAEDGAVEAESAEPEPSADEESGGGPMGGASERSEAPAPASPAAAGPGSMKRELSGADDGDGGRAARLDALWQELDGALRLSTPNCPRGATLRDQICDLATAICRLAEREAEPEIQSRCKDASGRCSQARARLQAECAE